MSLFTDPDTRKRIEAIHHDAAGHAAIVQNAILKARAEDREPSTGIVQALVRNIATAQITAAMLLCIDNDVPLGDVRAMLNLDAILTSDAPQDLLDEFASIQHLDFKPSADNDRDENQTED